MRRFLIPLFSAVMTAAVSGAVALADPADPHVLDPCGDADVMVRVGDHVVGTPDPERAAGFDMKAAWFEDLYDAEGRHMGVRIHLRMCGDVPDPELMGSGWSVHWDLEGPCSRVVGLHDSPPPDDPSQGVVRRAYLQSQCARPGPIPGSVEVYIEWTERLGQGSYAVEGSEISWTLTSGTLPPERAGRLAFIAPGTTWSSPNAHARDGRWLTMAELEQPIPLRLTGPGAFDSTGSGRAFTVGQQTG